MFVYVTFPRGRGSPEKHLLTSVSGGQNRHVRPIRRHENNIPMILVVFIITSEGSKSSTHYLSDTNRLDVSSKGPSSGRRICLYR